MRTMTTAGDANTQAGMAARIYLVTALDGRIEYFYNADGEMLFVPQQGALRLVWTELGRIEIEPGEIAVIPRGVKFRVELPDGPARGYLCENYGGAFTLPERGPIGANCLANPRDFKTPVAAYEDKETPSTDALREMGRQVLCHQTEIGHSPLDVVAWHGNYAPYKYDLRHLLAGRRDPVRPSRPVDLHGADLALGDRPAPPISTSSSSPSAGSVAEHTFRPPWYHMNIMSEFMGLIYGQLRRQDRRRLRAGRHLACTIACCRTGPTRDAFEKASTVELKPVKLDRHDGLHVRDALSPARDQARGNVVDVAG
jgi:homogentisate 1,2-dioxygenase